MKKIKIKTIILNLIISIFLFLAILPYSIHADSIRVSPAIYTPVLSPGKTLEYDLTLENLLSIPLPVKLSLDDFQVQDKTGNIQIEDNSSSSVKSWVKMTPNDLILNPKEKRAVKIMIETPQEIPFGGYFGMIFAEIKSQDSQGASSTLNTKIGSLIVANIGQSTQATRNGDLNISSKPQQVIFSDKNLSIEFSVKNSSLYHFVARPFLSSSPLLSNTLHNEDLGEKFIFPYKSRQWSSRISPKLTFPGIYKLNLSISLGDGVKIDENFYVLYLPWQILLVGSLVTISGVVLIRHLKFKKVSLRKKSSKLPINLLKI
jgi:hypothetical protein